MTEAAEVLDDLVEEETLEEEVPEKTQLEKEASKLAKGIGILAELQNDSINSDFEDVELTYQELEFLISCLQLGQMRVVALKSVANNVNSRLDKISEMLDSLKEGLPKVNLS